MKGTTMSGDANNARLWTFADVYVSFSSAADPATINDNFGAGWDVIGHIDGDDGFTHTRDEDLTDHFAWGGIILRTARSHFKQTVKFSSLEPTRASVFRLQWPGSTQGGDLVVPVPEQIKIAFETTEGETKHRLISANYAEVAVDGDQQETEADMSKIPFIATIFPDSTEDPAVLWHEQNDLTPS